MKINWFKIDSSIFRFFAQWIYFGEDKGRIYKNIYKYLKIGNFCKDCEKDFRYCECDKEKINLNIYKFIYYNISKNAIVIIINQTIQLVEDYDYGMTNNDKENYIKLILKNIYENKLV